MESTSASRITPLREPDLTQLPVAPINTEAEQALLGAILVNNAAYQRVSEFLLAGAFRRRRARADLSRRSAG